MRRGFRGDERGQMIPLTLMLFLICILFAVPMLSAMQAGGEVIVVQRAADAAALVAAGQATITYKPVGPGQYCEQVSIHGSRTTTAAWQQWKYEMQVVPRIQTTAFAVKVRGQVVTVDASVAAPPGGFSLFGQKSLDWSVFSESGFQMPPGMSAC